MKVWMSTGTSAPETVLKKGLVCNGPRITGRDFLITLKPGESDDENLELTHLYDMSAPGEYTVQIERTFPEIGQLRSNTVTIKIAQ